jgi:hypothetical protein
VHFVPVEYLPAAQFVPAIVENAQAWPAGHAVHSVAPCEDAYVPVVQVVHVLVVVRAWHAVSERVE